MTSKNIENTRRNGLFTASFWICLTFIELLMALPLTTSAATGTPWWHNPQLEWKPFTGFSQVQNTNGYARSWNIEERSQGLSTKYFGMSFPSGGPQQFAVAQHIAEPVFIEVANGMPANSSVNSTVMCTWLNNYPEFFVGSSSGIWRYDEDTQSFVSVWYWNWDPTCIVSLGNALYGSVLSWGSQSGAHLWTPAGDTYWHDQGRTWQIWADPISGRYGEGIRYVRVTSPTSSLMLANTYWVSNGQYSRDGGVTFLSPVGIRADGQNLIVSDFYPYTNDIVIISAQMISGDDLVIGQLEGTMYSLKCPVSNIGTFFYSPSTRLLIVGNAAGTELYSAVLPAANQVLPELAIQNAVIVSWSTQYLTAILQGSTSPTGEWQVITAPRLVVGDQVQVAIPTDTPSRYFRMVLVP